MRNSGVFSAESEDDAEKLSKCDQDQGVSQKCGQIPNSRQNCDRTRNSWVVKMLVTAIIITTLVNETYGYYMFPENSAGKDLTSWFICKIIL